MKRDTKIFLIINLILVSVLVPSLIYYFGYYQYEQNQTQSIQTNTILLQFFWTVRVQGSAVDHPINLDWADFERLQNVSKIMGYKTSIEDTSHVYTGFSLKHLVHDIMNVSSYSEVTVKGQDGWQITYSQSDVDNWNEEILLVYKQDNLPILRKEYGGEGPVRTIVSQWYSQVTYGDDFNGRFCAKYVVTVEINL